jgi:hypothetical protein
MLNQQPACVRDLIQEGSIPEINTDSSTVRANNNACHLTFLQAILFAVLPQDLLFFK